MVRYQDWTGERKQKCKRGFATKREAQEWERSFQMQTSGDLDMTFEAFTELYTKDMKPRLKENTWLTKENIIQKKILPYFGKRKIRDMLKHRQSNKGDQPQDRAFRNRHNIQAGKQIEQCVRTELAFALGNQAAPYQPLHTFRSRTVRHIAGFLCFVFIQRFDLIIREDTPVQN